ncbi:MAG: hypothetical protein C0625_07970, partial [Arcobacter sp.]
MGPILTKYPVVLQVDGVSYDVVFTPLGKRGLKKLQDLKNKTITERAGVDAKIEERDYKKEQLLLTEKMIENLKEKDEKKFDLILEAKKLKSEIFQLNKEIKDEDSKFAPLDKEVEKYESLNYDLCFSGSKANELKNAIEEADISFSR